MSQNVPALYINFPEGCPQDLKASIETIVEGYFFRKEIALDAEVEVNCNDRQVAKVAILSEDPYREIVFKIHVRGDVFAIEYVEDDRGHLAGLVFIKPVKKL